jgi:hypothetical protein
MKPTGLPAYRSIQAALPAKPAPKAPKANHPHGNLGKYLHPAKSGKKC